MTDTLFRSIYVTTPTEQVALELGHKLVEARLAACANVLPKMTSVYWWEGKLNQDSEAVLILKTHQDRVETAIQAIKAAHPYDCPCIVALPIVAGHPDYLQWIRSETLPH